MTTETAPKKAKTKKTSAKKTLEERTLGKKRSAAFKRVDRLAKVHQQQQEALVRAALGL